MNKTRLQKSLSFILCIVLTAAITLCTTGCNGNNKETVQETTQSTASVLETQEKTVVGEGSTEFMFTVTDDDGNETSFTVHTDKKTVGEALLDANLIAGEEGEYGLYVKTVNGITADFDTDGKYWAFYIDGEYATSGVDVTEIKEGAVYSFKIEK